MIQSTPASTTERGRTSSTPRERVVAVEHLTKVFKDFWMRARVRSVDDLSFDVYRGEIFGLLGPNGSGKSTTIKILLGLLHKTSGRVSVFGKLPSDVAAKKRIGYLPEESYLYQFLNARETLDYYAKLFELDARTRERRIDELLDMVGLKAVQFRPVREYSKGMQRRIGIAQALINDPELLILDEPTTGLDPIGTRQIKDLILELGRRGKTVILSSHLLSDVEDCVDRMVILYGGKIQATGTCDELLESADKTTIETSALDEDTIREIDEVIRRRTGGQNAIDRVSSRAKLEELFVGIVEQAIAQRIETAGAQHGGQTAAFLRAEPETGGALIDSLVKGRAEDLAPKAHAEPPKLEPKGPDANLIGNLLNAVKHEEPARPPASVEPVKPAANVDLSMIGNLVDGDSAKSTPGNAPGKPTP